MTRVTGDVIILGKTKLRTGCCVGGFDLTNKRSVRLLKRNGEYQDTTTPYQLNEDWRINYEPVRIVQPPHTENVRVFDSERTTQDSVRLADAFAHFKVWHGSPNQLFDGLLGWTGNRSGYVNKRGVPEFNTGFWRSDKVLCLRGEYYWYADSFRLKYVGLQKPVQEIDAGALIRVSLATWLEGEGTPEPRCYLQLSGWWPGQ